VTPEAHITDLLLVILPVNFPVSELVDYLTILEVAAEETSAMNHLLLLTHEADRADTVKFI